MARKKLDIYDRIAADMERIRNSQGSGLKCHSCTTDNNNFKQKTL